MCGTDPRKKLVARLSKTKLLAADRRPRSDAANAVTSGPRVPPTIFATQRSPEETAAHFAPHVTPTKGHLLFGQISPCAWPAFLPCISRKLGTATTLLRLSRWSKHLPHPPANTCHGHLHRETSATQSRNSAHREMMAKEVEETATLANVHVEGQRRRRVNVRQISESIRVTLLVGNQSNGTSKGPLGKSAKAFSFASNGHSASVLIDGCACDEASHDGNSTLRSTDHVNTLVRNCKTASRLSILGSCQDGGFEAWVLLMHGSQGISQTHFVGAWIVGKHSC